MKRSEERPGIGPRLVIPGIVIAMAVTVAWAQTVTQLSWKTLGRIQIAADLFLNNLRR